MASSVALSIIIPTHKRPKVLARCLEHIEQQTVGHQLEVIVVADGPDEEAKRVVGALHATPMKFLEIPKSQQGIARNKGVEHARGKYVLFIGDDIFLAPHACEKHLYHLCHFCDVCPLVLGFTTWDPAAGITPVMRWLETSGWQFGYGMIARYAHGEVPKELQHKFTYTSHISLPTEIAKKFPFREDVTRYGWEDIEWGWRLKEANIPLFYEPDARALHHHRITLEQSLRRMEILGESAVAMEQRVPELTLVPRGFRRLKYKIAALLPGMRGSHTRAFLRGVNGN